MSKHTVASVVLAEIIDLCLQQCISSLRKSKAPTKKTKYDWSVLKDDDIQNKYTVTVKNKYAALCVEEDDASERYEKFIQCVTLKLPNCSYQGQRRKR